MCRGLTGWTLLFVLGCAAESPVRRPRATPKITRGHLGPTFKTVDEAAVAGCAYIWSQEPRATRQEYCGVIYRDAEGIKAGLPETDERPTRCDRPLEPPGTEPEGGYHNHRFGSEFSSFDRRLVTPLAMYLCTPIRLVKKLTSEGTVIVK